MTDPEKLANEVSNAFASKPKLHELDDGETVRLDVGYVVGGWRDMDHVTIEFHFGAGDPDAPMRITDTIDAKLDHRKLTDTSDDRHPTSYDIGWVELNNEGEIVEYEIDNEYLKPSLQD